MENQMSLRLVDELGRIVIPSHIRRAMNLSSGSTLEIYFSQSQQQVTLKAHTYICDFCGEPQNLSNYKNHHICPHCKKDISAL